MGAGLVQSRQQLCERASNNDVTMRLLVFCPGPASCQDAGLANLLFYTSDDSESVQNSRVALWLWARQARIMA